MDRRTIVARRAHYWILNRQNQVEVLHIRHGARDEFGDVRLGGHEPRINGN